MSKPTISFGCSLYDRLLPLYVREVEVEGYDIDFVPSHGAMGARAIFDIMGKGEGFDVSEMSSSEYVSAIGQGDRRHVAIPVFPSRAFRSNCIFVRNDRVRIPADLEGRKIGVPLFTMTAAVFARGFLSDEFGFDPDSCTWIQGAMYQSGAHGNPNAPPLARAVRLEQNRSVLSLSQLLAEGAIDATLGPFIPDCYKENPLVQRLFSDFRTVERDYYQRTGIFPIMHLVVIKRDVCEKYPDLPQKLFNAFTRSKDLALARMKDVASLQYMLPWLAHDVEEIDDFFGGDPWPYGVEKNRATLEALCRYLHEQGLTAHRVRVESLFASIDETLVL